MRCAALSALVFSTMLMSCVTVQQRDDIEVTLVNVRLAEATAWETTAFFTVRVANASTTPLILSGSAHKFYLNGNYVGQALTGQRLEVPRFSSVTQEVPVQLRNLALLKQIRPILDSRVFEYRILSSLYLGEGAHPERCRLAEIGRLALDDFRPHPQSDPAPR